MGGAVFPLHWLFDLSFPRTGACRLLRGPGLQKASRTQARCLPLASVHTDRYSLGSPPAVSMSREEAQRPPAPCHQEALRGQHVSAQAPVVTAFLAGAQCTSCAPPGVASLLPPVLWCSCAQTPLTFRAECSGGSSSQCQSPWPGAF